MKQHVLPRWEYLPIYRAIIAVYGNRIDKVPVFPLIPDPVKFVTEF